MSRTSKSLNSTFSRSPWDDLDGKKDVGNDFFAKNYKKLNKKIGNFDFNVNNSNKILLIIGIVMLVLWVASGFYSVKEGEEAVVLRLGKFVRIARPGLNYHLPDPIERVSVEKVNKSRRIEIGYRSGVSRYSEDVRYTSSDSLMLAGDETIVELNADIMWHIKDLKSFMFNVVNPEEVVKTVAESSIREIIGQTPIAAVLSNQKQEIADQIEDLMRKTLDQYNAGIQIEQVQLLKAEPPSKVIDSYRDVQTARADKEREINQAQAYRNDVIPKARGEAAKILQDAEGYRQEVMSKAEGDTKRFNAILQEYLQHKQITKDRLYLDSVEEILKDNNKVITSASVLPHMALQSPNNNN